MRHQSAVGSLRRGSHFRLTRRKRRPINVELAPPLVEPFVAWQWVPTSIAALDFLLDALAKLLLLPVLLVLGVADALFDLRWFDKLHTAFAKHKLLPGNFNEGLRQLRSTTRGEASDVIARLARTGALRELLKVWPRSLTERFWGLALSKIDSAEAGAILLHEVESPLLVRRLKARRLLAETERLLGQALPAPPLQRPLLIAHRGLATRYAENTLPALDAALDAGADGVEVDLCMTADGEVILWHDPDPDAPIAILRQAGLEPGQSHRPVMGLRKPVSSMTAQQVQEHLGYASGSQLIKGVPTAAELAAWALRRRPKRLILDVKLPAKGADVTAFAARMVPLLPLAEQCVVMSMHAPVLDALREALGPGFHYTLDVEIVDVAPRPEAITGLEQGVAMGNDFVSIGRPRVGIDGYATFLETLTLHALRWGSQRPRVIVWTINDPDEFLDIIGTGLVDEVMTDHVDPLRSLLEQVLSPTSCG